MPSRPTRRPAGPSSRRTSRRTPGAQEQVRRPRPKMTGRMVVVLIIAFVLAVSYASSLKAYLRQRDALNALEATIAQDQAEITAKQNQVNRLKDPNYIKILAHQELGYVMPGAITYTALDAHGNKINPQVQLDNQSAVGAPQAPVAWWTTVQGSINAAGHPTATTPVATLNH